MNNGVTLWVNFQIGKNWQNQNGGADAPEQKPDTFDLNSRESRRN